MLRVFRRWVRSLFRTKSQKSCCVGAVAAFRRISGLIAARLPVYSLFLQHSSDALVSYPSQKCWDTFSHDFTPRLAASLPLAFETLLVKRFQSRLYPPISCKILCHITPCRFWVSQEERLSYRPHIRRQGLKLRFKAGFGLGTGDAHVVNPWCLTHIQPVRLMRVATVFA